LPRSGVMSRKRIPGRGKSGMLRMHASSSTPRFYASRLPWSGNVSPRVPGLLVGDFFTFPSPRTAGRRHLGTLDRHLGR
jgi:hypothetical protein